MTDKKNKNEYTKTSFPRFYLEKAGERHIKQILEVIENVPWGITFLQLAWVAGPVTFIALQGGYLLGYGKTAPFSLFAYFAAYTLIAGFIGITVSIIYKTLRERKKEQAEHNLLYVIDKLADLISYFRDFRLGQLDEKERKLEAAHILLKNSHPLPQAIAVAVEDITNDRKLAQAIKKIEIFRRAGLFTRASDLVKEIADQCEDVTQKLINTHPEMAQFLKFRLQGHAPSLKDGIPRPEGFLERIFSSGETGNLSLMTIRDAEELLILMFELINGRKIRILKFRFIGNKRLREITNNLESIRAAYRISKSTMNYRLQTLISLLIEKKLMVIQGEADLSFIYSKILQAIDIFSQDILKNKHRTRAQRLEKFKLLDKIISLHTMMFNDYKIARAQQRQYATIVKQWQKIATTYSDNAIEFRHGKGRRGLRITETSISLDDENKLKLAKEFTIILREFYEQYPTLSTYSEKSIKQLAISVTLTAEPFLNLSHPVIQRGIESTNAANLGSLEEGISAQAKAGWTTAMVQEVEKNIGRSAERLASVLVQQYGEELDTEAIDFLHNTYGASKSVLEAIKEQKISPKSSMDYLTPIQPIIEPIKTNWLQAKVHAQKILKS